MNIVIKPFGQTQAGEAVSSITLYQQDGSFCTLLTYGAILQRLLVPDRDGLLQDVVLGFDTLAEYESKNNPYHGAVVGRFANRIEDAAFELDGQTYHLSANYGPHHIHGGVKGFDRVVWQADPFDAEEGPSVRFFHHSPDGDEGYPGNLDVSVTYTWTRDHRLILRYWARSDRKTVLNLTNHAYFNLHGQGSGQVLDHLVQLEADAFTPSNTYRLPVGTIEPVAGTPLDFRTLRRIGDGIDAEHPAMAFEGGYDHNLVVRGENGVLRPCATVVEPKSGRKMVVETTMPAVQLYTANTMKHMNGKEGVQYESRSGFCLETQQFPNAPRIKQFPSAVLQAHEENRQTTIYAFSIDSETVR